LWAFSIDFFHIPQPFFKSVIVVKTPKRIHSNVEISTLILLGIRTHNTYHYLSDDDDDDNKDDNTWPYCQKSHANLDLLTNYHINCEDIVIVTWNKRQVEQQI
jgi:hypothetical protein